MQYDVLVRGKWRRRKKSFLRAFLVFLIILFVFLGSIVGIFAWDKFKIKFVIVEGAFVLSENEIRKEIENIMSIKVLGIIPQDRIFSFPIKNARENLYSQFGRLSYVEIERNFPDKILIKVEERKPVAVLCLSVDKECFFIDKTSFVFESAPFFSSGVFVKFFDERDLRLGQREFLLEEEIFEKLLSFKKRLESNFQVIEIHLKDKDVCEFYMQDGWRLIFNEKDDLDLVYGNFMVFFKEIMDEYSNKNIEYIDLRFGNKVFYK